MPLSLHRLREHFFDRFKKPTPRYMIPPIANSYIQKLPTELTLRLFQLFISDLWSQSDSLGVIQALTPRKGSTIGEYVSRMRERYKSLCRVILVCQTWHSIGTEILYSTPVLTTPSQLRLFTRTMESTSSTLAHLVNVVSVIEIIPPEITVNSLERFTGWGDIRKRDAERSVLSQVEFWVGTRDLLIACSSIPAVEFFTMSSLNQSGNAGFGTHVDFPSPRPHEVLPQGQIFFELSCRSHSSRLRALRIQSDTGAVFPSFLSPLHFLQADVTSFSGFAGSCSHSNPPPLPTAAIHTIAFGPLTGNSNWLSHWRVPKTVERLMIFVNPNSPDLSWDPVILGIFDCLKRSVWGHPHSLRQVNIFLDPNFLGSRLEAAHFAFYDIMHLSEQNHVNFRLHEEREFPP